MEQHKRHRLQTDRHREIDTETYRDTGENVVLLQRRAIPRSVTIARRHQNFWHRWLFRNGIEVRSFGSLGPKRVESLSARFLVTKASETALCRALI